MPGAYRRFRSVFDDLRPGRQRRASSPIPRGRGDNRAGLAGAILARRPHDDRQPRGCLEHASILSLDHDLNRVSGESDPGTGYDVAKLPEELVPCCPIVIHTSNGERGKWMEAVLSRAGWHYDRVYPFGDDSIETDRAPVSDDGLGERDPEAPSRLLLRYFGRARCCPTSPLP
jgi:hypothetical protein